jgi:predicted deacylase
MATLPATYEASRERFRRSLSHYQSTWPGARLTSLPLKGQPDLTIEVISADATREKQRLLFLTTGLHGIEGYVGSGILQLFGEEFLPRLRPATTGIVVVHPINPHGMKHLTRYNGNNVDLNRNFSDDFEALTKLNPHYESLSALFNPQRPLKSPLYEKTAFLWNLVKALPKGTTHIREAALMGQYRVPKGIYFGGFERQEETRRLADLFQRHIMGYTQVLALDIHAGYGPRWGLTLVNPAREKRSATEIAARYSLPLVVGSNPEEFYTTHGEMGDYLYDMAASVKSRIFAGMLEFGTYGDLFWQGVRSLRTSVLENCLHWHGGSESARRWMKHEYDELYIPSEPKWWQVAQANARLYLENILRVEGFFNPLI